MRRRRNDRGFLNLEFIFTSLAFLGSTFTTVHFLLIARADVVVQHAAAAAVRSAVTVMDDQEDRYGGEARGSTTGARHQAVLEAARGPLVALAPSSSAAEGRSLATMLPDDESRMALASAWNDGAVQVSFPSGEGASGFVSNFGPNDSITVRVTYLYPCALPLIDYGCKRLDALGLAPQDTPEVSKLRALFPDVRVWVFQAEATMPNQGASYEYEGEL
jgi:hypothetical protein